MTTPTTRTAKLRAKYGAERVRDAAEVMAFQDAMRGAGLGQDATCVLGAWMGGASPQKQGFFAALLSGDASQTAPQLCGAGIDAFEALHELYAIDPSLSELVRQKAEAKMASRDAQADATAADAANRKTVEGLEWTGDRLAEVGRGAGNLVEGVTGGFEGLTTGASFLAKNLVWIVAGVLAVVMIGGAVYVWRNGQLVAKVAAKVAA